MYKRQGNLFNAKFKRSIFDSEYRFKDLQYYIHPNARKHKVVKDFKEYPHTSYHEIVEGNDWLIDVVYVLNKFENLEGFIQFNEDHNRTNEFDLIIIE